MGYQLSKIDKDCIRLFERAMVYAIENNTSSIKFPNQAKTVFCLISQAWTQIQGERQEKGVQTCACTAQYG